MAFSRYGEQQTWDENKNKIIMEMQEEDELKDFIQKKWQTKATLWISLS